MGTENPFAFAGRPFGCIQTQAWLSLYTTSVARRSLPCYLGRSQPETLGKKRLRDGPNIVVFLHSVLIQHRSSIALVQLAVVNQASIEPVRTTDGDAVQSVANDGRRLRQLRPESKWVGLCPPVRSTRRHLTLTRQIARWWKMVVVTSTYIHVPAAVVEVP